MQLISLQLIPFVPFQVPIIIYTGRYNIEERGEEIKGFGDGEGNQRGEKEKKGKLRENITFGRSKS